ncbi:hypothetical protein KW795_02975, partial [Candidatus Microgenomates bacterium]|nr:hypothetical protein [Candidatus Microgenomates bacterium]
GRRSTYYADSNTLRKEAVKEYMISLLGPDRRASEKSLQIAEKLAIASLETSCWNRSALFGNDELAEIIGMKEWRKRRSEPGRSRGPLIHEDYIPGFGTSWLRFTVDSSNIVPPDQPFYVRDINLDELTIGAWQGHCSFRIGRFNALRGLLLDRSPKPGSINLSFLQEAVPYFNEVDKPEKGMKCGPLLLRAWWLLGVVSMASADPSLQWSPGDINDLRQAVCVDKLSPSAGTFITEQQWNWVIRETKAANKISRQQSGQALRQIGSKILGGKG